VLKYYLLGAIAMLSLAVSNSAISSDCTHVSSKIEKLICSPNTIGVKWLDELLNSEYKRAIDRTENPEEFRSNQRIWLKTKRDKCLNAMCLRRVYIERIAQISRSSDDIEGVYLTNGDCISEPWRDENGDFIGKKCQPSPINYLKIESVSDNKYRVTSDVSQFATGNFGCSADAYMLRKGDTLQLSKWADGEGLDPKCPFSVKIGSEKFDINTKGQQCGLCGQNGNFDGEVFPRKSNAK